MQKFPSGCAVYSVSITAVNKHKRGARCGGIMSNNNLKEVDGDFTLIATIVWKTIVPLPSTPWNSINRLCSLMLTRIRIMIVMNVGSEMDTFVVKVVYWKFFFARTKSCC